VKIVFIAFLFAASGLAQNSSSVCGRENVSFKVTLDKSHPSLPKPEPGKATVVFIQDFGGQKFGIGVHVTTRIGVDGSWVVQSGTIPILPFFLTQENAISAWMHVPDCSQFP
jgi:hypothetical protein